jgi:hypothetical protein
MQRGFVLTPYWLIYYNSIEILCIKCPIILYWYFTYVINLWNKKKMVNLSHMMENINYIINIFHLICVCFIHSLCSLSYNRSIAFSKVSSKHSVTYDLVFPLSISNIPFFPLRSPSSCWHLLPHHPSLISFLLPYVWLLQTMSLWSSCEVPMIQLVI